jgi:hypothetical protein
MPLGKVFDAREGQILSKPVSAHYAGKALRADIAIKEKQAERLQQEVDANLPEAQVRQADERIDLQKQQEDRLREIWDSEKDAAEKQKFVDVLDASEAAYQNSLAGGSSEEEARTNAFDVMLAEADRLNGEGTEAEARAELEAMGFTPDLWDPVMARSKLGLRPTQEKPVVLAEGAQLRDAEGNLIAENPKDFAPDTSQTKPTYDPPNTAELAAAEELIEKDPVLDELSRKDKAVAKMMLANDIRQLQEDLGIDYAQAAETATNQLKRRIRTEKGFLFGEKSVLDVSGDGLAENEYLGKDGNVYIEEPDGSFRRK